MHTFSHGISLTQVLSATRSHVVPEFGRRHATRILEIFAQEALIGEIQFLRYFLYTKGRMRQHGLGLYNDEGSNPLPRRAATHLLRHLAEVLRRNAQFAAIPLHTTLTPAILRQQTDKAINAA